jgi:predicted nucleic acid-binding protein
MTAADRRPVFLDTNVLVYANLASSPFHKAATDHLQALDQQQIELWVSRQILREYLAAITRPGTLTGTIPVVSLTNDVRYFAQRFRLAEDGPTVTAHLLTLMDTIVIGGAQVHDANVVATMQAHGIERLLTHNTGHFARFAGLITVLPLVPPSP